MPRLWCDDAVGELLSRRAPYGKSAADRQRVREVEPLSRRTAHHEVAPTEPLDEVASTVLRLAGAAA